MRRISTIVKLAAVAAFTIVASGDTQALRNSHTTAIEPPDSRYFGAVSQSENGDQVVLRIEGVITNAVAHDFMNRLDAISGLRPATIELDSPGGFTKAGYAVIEAILYQRRRGRPVATIVHGNSACQSMCVGIYMAGFPRYADPSAQFMVHAPRGEKTGLVGIRATREMIDRLASLGVSPDWLKHVQRNGGFSGRVDFPQSARELVGTGANIVTRLLSGS